MLEPEIPPLQGRDFSTQWLQGVYPHSGLPDGKFKSMEKMRLQEHDLGDNAPTYEPL